MAEKDHGAKPEALAAKPNALSSTPRHHGRRELALARCTLTYTHKLSNTQNNLDKKQGWRGLDRWLSG